MISAISEYLPTAIIALVLIGIAAAVVAGVIWDKKAGKSCGFCSCCPMAESCKKDKCGKYDRK